MDKGRLEASTVAGKKVDRSLENNDLTTEYRNCVRFVRCWNNTGGATDGGVPFK